MKHIQIWLNPSWRAFSIGKGFPDGFMIRVGRMVIKFGGSEVPAKKVFSV